MKRLFTSESVSEGHPDKVADQVSDSILDAFLACDKDSRVAVETLVTAGQVIVVGEVTSNVFVDIQKVVRNTIKRIGYTKAEYMFDYHSCGILSAIHEQSPDISIGVNRENERLQGAGDQGMVFGYATNETNTYMPVEHYLATHIMQCLAEIRHDGRMMPYLRPDAKSQVTVEYDKHGNPMRVDTIVVSAQHDEFASDIAMQETIKYDIINTLIPYVKAKMKDERVQSLLDNEQIMYHVNPTGKFVMGGPAGDTGLTGRKIIVDTYGGRASHGGGAFSGKDPSKVDRSAAYVARFLSKNLVAHGIADKMQIQISYAIGVAEPISVNVDTYGTLNNNLFKSDEDISEWIMRHYDLSPYGIEQLLYLKQPIYEPTAAYGHFGREPYEKDGLQFFPWEVVLPKDDFMNHNKF